MLNKRLKIKIIGSGFASLSAACYLAKEGHSVHIFEKNDSIGGRARRLEANGFRFDMGPSWYWMPDVFDRFFQDFNKKTSDFYSLKKLSPAYAVHFNNNESILIGDQLSNILDTFELIEKGAGSKLKKFINKAKSNYEIAIKDLVYRPGSSPLELITPKTIFKLGQFFKSISDDIKNEFKDPRLIKILEFPSLFLGAKPSDTPSFYNFMNYADFGLGTWYPDGGMYSIVEGMENLALSLGVQFQKGAEIKKINVTDGKVISIHVNDQEIPCDILVSGADYHHTETLLDLTYRQYSEAYWEKKIFAPSALLFYVGINKRLSNIHHHMLFFDGDFEVHAREIYDLPAWPSKPLFYGNFPSVTDTTAAPAGMENAFFLIPLSTRISDTVEKREEYFKIILDRFEAITGQSIKDHIVFKKSYCKNDFIEDYHSYGGNAYGLANTLLQTAFLKPKLKSSKVNNLYFTGQLTVPGPGVPPALISGKLVAALIHKSNKTIRA